MIDVRKSKDEIVAAVMCTLIMWMMVMIMMMMMEMMLLDNDGGDDVQDRGGGRSDVHLVAELVVAAKHDQTAPRDLVCANSYIQFFLPQNLPRVSRTSAQQPSSRLGGL